MRNNRVRKFSTTLSIVIVTAFFGNSHCLIHGQMRTGASAAQPQVSLLGFKADEPLREAVAHALDLHYVAQGQCKQETEFPTMSDCAFEDRNAMALKLRFRNGQLQTVDYDFPVAQYRQVLATLTGDNGKPRRFDPDGSGAMVSQEWGTSSTWTMSLSKSLDDKRGNVTLVILRP